MYFTVTEHNDWEGETWHFHFPVPDNEVAISQLREHLANDEFVAELHVVADRFLEESAVDVLVENDPNHGYMAGHHKCGPLDIDTILALEGEELARALYKGQIRKLEVGSAEAVGE